MQPRKSPSSSALSLHKNVLSLGGPAHALMGACCWREQLHRVLDCLAQSDAIKCPRLCTVKVGEIKRHVSSTLQSFGHRLDILTKSLAGVGALLTWAK